MSVEVTEATKVFRTTYFLEINNLMARIILFCFFEEEKKNNKISNEIFPSFRTEAAEDRHVTFDQIKGS